MPKRVDSVQPQIVDSLRRLGVSICHLHSLGHGVPDILCGYRGINTLMEIKSGPRAKLTEDELRWHARWAGQVAVVHSVEEALDILGVVRGR